MKKIKAKEAYRLMDQLGLDYGDDGTTYYATDADEVGMESAGVWEFDSKRERDEFVAKQTPQEWELEKARKESNERLKNWLWAASANGQPIPGNISTAACRKVLIERGEDGKGYHEA